MSEVDNKTLRPLERREFDSGRGRSSRVDGQGRREGSGNRGRGDKGGARHTSDLNKRPLFIISTNFREIFHGKINKAARYKVYAPLSQCSKVSKFRQRYTSSVHASRVNDETNVNEADVSQQLSKLNLNNNSKEDQLFNNLVVVPDTKSPQAVYICKGTDLESFKRDGIMCELKLAKEIFGDEYECNGTQDSAAGNGAIPLKFKISCAQCLLTTHYPNGFVAIVGNTQDELQSSIDHAREAAAIKKANNSFHADHAHFVCVLEVGSLQSLVRASKTRSMTRQVHLEILTMLSNGSGTQLSEEAFSQGQSASIKLGHHLTSLLYNLPKNRQPRLVMVLGYTDGPLQYELDLPGGKRHLGETTLQGAIREVEEECSLLIDREWMASHVIEQYGGNVGEGRGGKEVQVLVPRNKSETGNVYFVMSPPSLARKIS